MKIISLIILVTFLFANTTYPAPSTNTLRVPLGASKRVEKTINAKNPSLASDKELTDNVKSGVKDFPAGENVPQLISSLSKAKDREEAERISETLLNRSGEEVNRHLQALVDILNDSGMNDYASRAASKVICKVAEPTQAAAIILNAIDKEDKSSFVLAGLVSAVRYDVDMSSIAETDRISIAQSLITKVKKLISEEERLGGDFDKKVAFSMKWGFARNAIYATIAVLGPSAIKIAIENTRDISAFHTTPMLAAMINIDNDPMTLLSREQARKEAERNSQIILEHLAQTDDTKDITHILDVVYLLKKKLSPREIAKVLIAKYKETENERFRDDIAYTLGRSLGYKKILGKWIRVYRDLDKHSQKEALKKFERITGIGIGGPSDKSFPIATGQREISRSNVEELLNSRLSQYEGILISNDVRVVVNPNVPTAVNKFAALLGSSLSKIGLLSSYNMPDNGIEIHVVEYLPTNVRKAIDLSGRVHFLFDKYFVETLISIRDEYPVAVPWVLGERLAHELSHSNTVGTQQQEKEDEMDVIINADLQLYRRLLANEPLKDEVDRFFAEAKPTFGSGRYFNGLLGEVAYKSSGEIRKEVGAYLDIYYDFNTTDFPGGWRARMFGTHILIQKVIFARKNGLTDMAADNIHKIISAGQDAVPALAQALSGEDQVTRKAALFILYTADPEGWGMNLFRESLTNKSDYVGFHAAEGIAQLLTLSEVRNQAGLPKVISAEKVIPILLRKTFDDKSGRVQHAAGNAIVKIGVEALPMLKEYLSNKDDKLRCAAVSTLARMGSIAKDTMPAIRDLLNDEEAHVRENAKIALEMLESAHFGTKDFPIGFHANLANLHEFALTDL